MGGPTITAAIDRASPAAERTLRRARSGELAAFEELYRRHVDRVFALCLRMTADPTRAEDHTQDTFIRAWERLATYRGESEFATWLSRVAVNVVRCDRRSRVRRDERERPLDEADDPGRSGPQGTALDLERAIGTLPEGAREVFVLHDVEGYRHEEIAGLLEVSTGTSKSQLHRARRLLREALGS